MKFLIKNNLNILSVYALVMLGIFAVFWSSFSVVQRITIGFLGLITLHEWEETRFPGGFFEVMGGIMQVDFAKAPEGSLHLPVTVYIIVITLLPLLFPGFAGLFLAVMFLGIFEGIIHIAGIKLGRMKKPYTPGMVTAEVMLVYSIVSIYLVFSAGLVASMDWLLGFVVFLAGFLMMETGVYRALDLKPADVIKSMKANIKRMQG